MYIPKEMKKKISSVFYDKDVYVLEKKDIIDAEGGVTSVGYDVINSFKGNVSFSNCKKIQEEYGLDCKIDISITTDYALAKIADFIKYNDIVYSVTDILASDSHFLIVASKWQQ